MQTALHLTAEVQPGGKIEITDTLLRVGTSVEVIVLLPAPSLPPRPMLRDVLAMAPGQRLFHTAADVDAFVRAERDTWER